MADDSAAWMTQNVEFEVSWDALVIKCAEVTGLNIETRPIEYRGGSGPFSPIKMPGIAKISIVTLKRGIAPNTPSIQAWITKVTANQMMGTEITITMRDESGSPTMTWILSNASAIKMGHTNLMSDNQIAIDTIDIKYDSLSITNG